MIDPPGPSAAIIVGVGRWREGRAVQRHLNDATQYVGIDPIHDPEGFPGHIEKAMAWSSKVGIKPMYGKGERTSAFSRPGQSISGEANTTTVDLVADKYAVELNKPVLLWIDTEGSEPYVLMGAKKVMKSCQWVILEMNYRSLRNQPSPEDAVRILKQHGFKLQLEIGRCSRATDAIFMRQ